MGFRRRITGHERACGSTQDKLDRRLARSTGAFHGLKQGSEVVVHATASGAKKTALEVDAIGKHGMLAVEGTVSNIGAGGNNVSPLAT